MLAILCHLLKGEAIIQEKLAKEKETATTVATTTTTTTTTTATTTTPSTTTRTTGRVNELEDQGINADHLQQLQDMGFPREMALDALMQTTSLEQATDYLLSHPGPLRQATVCFFIELIIKLEDTYQRPVSRCVQS